MNLTQISRSWARTITVALMGGAVVIATGDGFAQSYAGLLGWAHEHRLTGWRAGSFPLLIDLFVGIGEAGLFLLAIDGHRLNRRALSWIDLALPAGTATTGWVVSLAFNVGRIRGGSLADQVTAAVPPVAAMVGLLILLRTLHRYVSQTDTGQQHPAGDAEPPQMTVTVEAGPPVELPAGDDLDESEFGDGFDTPDGDNPAGQGERHGLASAVRSAHAAGWTKTAISEEYGLSRYKVNRLLGEQLTTATAALNGHPIDNPTTEQEGD